MYVYNWRFLFVYTYVYSVESEFIENESRRVTKKNELKNSQGRNEKLNI